MFPEEAKSVCNLPFSLFLRVLILKKRGDHGKTDPSNNYIRVIFLNLICGSLMLVFLWSEDRADIFSQHFSAKQ